MPNYARFWQAFKNAAPSCVKWCSIVPVERLKRVFIFCYICQSAPFWASFGIVWHSLLKYGMFWHDLVDLVKCVKVWHGCCFCFGEALLKHCFELPKSGEVVAKWWYTKAVYQTPLNQPTTLHHVSHNPLQCSLERSTSVYQTSTGLEPYIQSGATLAPHTTPQEPLSSRHASSPACKTASGRGITLRVSSL